MKGCPGNVSEQMKNNAREEIPRKAAGINRMPAAFCLLIPYPLIEYTPVKNPFEVYS
jgi:hypothetical protein